MVSWFTCYGDLVITTLRITGMSCNGCVRHVGEALRAVPGVSQAEVEIGRAKVTHDDRTTVASLITAIESAGYEVSRNGEEPPIRAP